ncbi:MAG: hypothetical protein CMG08_01925 [Candidatus Marinimicrobia bacterium]|nr:hypothetical protein [Candidatus Neomarinimicrobiota bacterium]
MNINSNIDQIQSLIHNTVSKKGNNSHNADIEKKEPFTSLFEEKLVNQKKEMNGVSNEPLLSSKEEATLDALFGVGADNKSSFYGVRKLQNIHRGHLIDIKG